MSRLHFKGGAWTNAEDQVLQAGLSQYGIRDWERVASLLVKKTAAQCRERWENFLDPRLNLTETWSVEEEEKLVQLQQLFPNQWKLISAQLTRSTPNKYIRPAWLCEEHYLELKDAFDYEQENMQNTMQATSSSNANFAVTTNKKMSFEEFMSLRRRKRAPYKTHEEKPARADIIANDMYEKEMIEMAVSRLANQDQKKGLRKERQRQLEEARFLAKLENNREGVASGTLSGRQAKRIRRALEEDAHGVGVIDEINEDKELEEEEQEEKEQQESRKNKKAKREKRFTPIDLNDEEARAGTSHKQRTLLKDLDAEKTSNKNGSEQEGNRNAIHAVLGNRAGVNMELLEQLASSKDVASNNVSREEELEEKIVHCIRDNNNVVNNSNTLLEYNNSAVKPVLTWDALATSITPVHGPHMMSTENYTQGVGDVHNYLNVLQETEQTKYDAAAAATTSSSLMPDLDLLFAELNADSNNTNNNNNDISFDFVNNASHYDNDENNITSVVNEKAITKDENENTEINNDLLFTKMLAEEEQESHSEELQNKQNTLNGIETLMMENANNKEENNNQKEQELFELLPSESLEDKESLHDLDSVYNKQTYKEHLRQAREMINDEMHRQWNMSHNLQQTRNSTTEMHIETSTTKETGSQMEQTCVDDVVQESELNKAKEMIDDEVCKLYKSTNDNTANNKITNSHDAVHDNTTTEKKFTTPLLISNDVNAKQAILWLEKEVEGQCNQERLWRERELELKASKLICYFYDECGNETLNRLIQEREDMLKTKKFAVDNNSSRTLTDVNAQIITAMCNYWTEKLQNTQKELRSIRAIRLDEQNEIRDQLTSFTAILETNRKREKVLQTMYKEHLVQTMKRND